MQTTFKLPPSERDFEIYDADDRRQAARVIYHKV